MKKEHKKQNSNAPLSERVVRHCDAARSGRRAYSAPVLKKMGSVSSLTLKLGSSTDSGMAGRTV